MLGTRRGCSRSCGRCWVGDEADKEPRRGGEEGLGAGGGESGSGWDSLTGSERDALGEIFLFLLLSCVSKIGAALWMWTSFCGTLDSCPFFIGATDEGDGHPEEEEEADKNSLRPGLCSYKAAPALTVLELEAAAEPRSEPTDIPNDFTHA